MRTSGTQTSLLTLSIVSYPSERLPVINDEFTAVLIRDFLCVNFVTEIFISSPILYKNIEKGVFTSSYFYIVSVLLIAKQEKKKTTTKKQCLTPSCGQLFFVAVSLTVPGFLHRKDFCALQESTDHVCT